VTEPAARTWSPQPAVVAVAWILAVATGGFAAFTDDPPGQVLLGSVALLLALAAVFATVARPRLAADHHGIAVRGLTGTRRWTWAEVNVRVVRTRRLGRETATLEVDAENAEPPALVVLGRLDLGADPEDVIEELVALRT
jgi:Bacterial PH domain